MTLLEGRLQSITFLLVFRDLPLLSLAASAGTYLDNSSTKMPGYSLRSIGDAKPGDQEGAAYLR